MHQLVLGIPDRTYHISLLDLRGGCQGTARSLVALQGDEGLENSCLCQRHITRVQIGFRLPFLRLLTLYEFRLLSISTIHPQDDLFQRLVPKRTLRQVRAIRGPRTPMFPR